MILESREISMHELLKNNIDISEVVEMETKSYPNNSHWDKNSKDYVHSERDE